MSCYIFPVSSQTVQQNPLLRFQRFRGGLVQPMYMVTSVTMGRVSWLTTSSIQSALVRSHINYLSCLSDGPSRTLAVPGHDGSISRHYLRIQQRYILPAERHRIFLHVIPRLTTGRALIQDAFTQGQQTFITPIKTLPFVPRQVHAHDSSQPSPSDTYVSSQYLPISAT
jgi:hypothetical protein